MLLVRAGSALINQSSRKMRGMMITSRSFPRLFVNQSYYGYSTPEAISALGLRD